MEIGVKEIGKGARLIGHDLKPWQNRCTLEGFSL